MLTAAILSLCLTGTEVGPGVLPAVSGPTMTLLVGHHFSRHDAHARLQQLLDYWTERFHLSQTWDGDRVFVVGTVMSVDFKAQLEVTDTAVRCESNDPGSFLRNPARDYVRNKLRKYLHPEYKEP
jgi:hypothetical protein